MHLPLPKEDFVALCDFFASAAKYGVDDSSAYAYSLAQRMGLSTSQSIQLISKLIDADGAISGYTFGSFSRALRTLVLSDVKPESVVRMFDVLGGTRPYLHQDKFDAFQNMVTFDCPLHRISPQELMDMLLSAVDSGETIEAVLTRFQNSDQKQLSGTLPFEVFSSQSEKNQYFIQKPGKLELAALPYQTKRSLQNGHRDLEEIAIASSAEMQEVGEGF